MVIPNQALKGQVFLKFLWQHDLYKTDGGVSPILSKDIKNIALTHEWINVEKNVTNKDVFNWINGSVIPKWVRLSAFEIAVRLHWQPVDLIDVLSVLKLQSEHKTTSINDVVEFYTSVHHLNFPKPILLKIVKDHLF